MGEREDMGFGVVEFGIVVVVAGFIEDVPWCMFEFLEQGEGGWMGSAACSRLAKVRGRPWRRYRCGELVGVVVWVGKKGLGEGSQ